MPISLSIRLGLGSNSAVSVLGSAPVGSVLSLSALSLTGASPITYQVQWRRNGVNISGATSASYTTLAADVGNTVDARVVLPDTSVLITTNSVAVVAAGGLPTILTLHDFSRDLVVFDTGAAFGSVAGLVPLSGTADPGAVVQYRVVTDAGVLVHDWADLATADSAGDWAGIAVADLTSAALRPEVRLKLNAAVTATTVNRFHAGHVVDVWGQSELHRSVLTGFTGAPGVTIADPAALQVSYSDATGASYGTALTHVFIDGSNANLAGRLGALANMLAAERPGERFHLVMHTLSQTGLRAALDESMTPRQWANETAIRDFALADGQHPGLAIQSWYNADATAFDASYGNVWMTAISGLNANGTPHTRGTAAPAGGFNMNYYFSDWYDYARTKWAMAGPHRFEAQNFDVPIQANRSGLNAAFANPIMSSRAVRVLEPLTYQNRPTDEAHPDTADIDGMSRFMALIGYGILQGMGLAPDTPELDQWSYNGTTDVLTIGSSAGAITTTRIARGGSLPSGRPKVDQVFRSGALVPDADLSFVGGNILVANVVDGDTVAVGLGGIGTAGLGAEDFTAVVDETWQDWPIVAGGLAWSGMEGLPVRGLAICPAGIIPGVSLPPDPNGNPNLFPAAVSNFTVVGSNTVSGWNTAPAPWVLDGAGTATSNASATQVNIAARSKAVGASMAGQMLELSFVAETPNFATGALRISVRPASAGVAYIFPAADVAITYGARNTIAMLTAYPASGSNDIDVTIQRVSGSTGTIVISQLTMKVV